jgi:hypothetical protein
MKEGQEKLKYEEKEKENWSINMGLINEILYKLF